MFDPLGRLRDCHARQSVVGWTGTEPVTGASCAKRGKQSVTAVTQSCASVKQDPTQLTVYLPVTHFASQFTTTSPKSTPTEQSTSCSNQQCLNRLRVLHRLHEPSLVEKNAPAMPTDDVTHVLIIVLFAIIPGALRDLINLRCWTTSRSFFSLSATCTSLAVLSLVFSGVGATLSACPDG